MTFMGSPPSARPRIVFFGTPQEAVWVLDTLAARGIIPSLVVTNPPRPAGRGKKLTPPPALLWTQERGIAAFSPPVLDDEAVAFLQNAGPWDVGIVAAYGLIIPQAVLSLPQRGILNIHPSLLPKLRGAAPVQAAILRDTPGALGVSIMLMDEKMDHGPILAQEPHTPAQWPTPYLPLQERLLRRGAELLADVLPQWLPGAITPALQDDTHATYCGKLEKAEVSLSQPSAELWRLYCALVPRPGVFFWDTTKNPPKRIKIQEAELTPQGKFMPLVVVPESKPPMRWEDYACGIAKSHPTAKS
ncbi:methionyl-tRNA formyltransferase [Candidatus Parcubacteria bacterium]|nr:MAG: methionyl-tRNA formyltransferase [Candidatus Parcubacteria bacterium]